MCNVALARHFLALGALFVAVGVDTSLLVRATAALAAQFKTTVADAAPFLTDYRGKWLELHLMWRIQQALDPLVLMNPGKLLKLE